MYRVTINQRPDVMAYRRATDALRRLEQLKRLAGQLMGASAHLNYRITKTREGNQ